MKRKNKTIYFALVLLSIFVTLCFTSGCSSRQRLLFLNWGEYINDELIEKFEKENNCELIVDLAESNELFYAKLKSGTTAYDLCCPAEYMVEKMYLNDLIQPIDFSKIPSYSDDKQMKGVLEIEEGMNTSMIEICAKLGREYKDNEINQYHVPYFWGTFGLLYNKGTADKPNPIFVDNATYSHYEKISDTPDGEPDILQKSDPWKVYFFDESLSKENRLPDNAKVGMYDSVRFNYGAVMTYYAGNPNVSLTDKIEGASYNNLTAYEKILSRRKYREIGGDSLKKGIESGNLDIAFAYTGDCLDMCYLRFKDGIADFETLDFFVYVPEVTMAHIDTLVIPKDARHVDLAHKFLEFLQQPENVWLNARDVGYCPPLQEVYDWIISGKGPETGSYSELTEEEVRWRANWGKTLSAAFPVLEDGVTSAKSGTPFSYFENNEIKQLQNVLNNIIAKY